MRESEVSRPLYLSSSTRHFFEFGLPFGCMFNITQRVGQQIEALKAGVIWMLDNGAFTGKWTLYQWLSEMEALKEWRDTCLGVIVPDVVFDWRKTVAQFSQLAPMVKRQGYRVLFATQDGQPTELVPWPAIDGLFIGGSDEHKRGPEAERLALEARRRGKWIHVGRCNAGSTAIQYWPWADSFDGTTFKHHPYQQVDSIVNGLSLLSQGLPEQRKLL